jgi:hypothetical protein
MTQDSRDEGATVKVTKLAATCENGDCPTLYATDRGTLLVQGEVPADHGLQMVVRDE